MADEKKTENPFIRLYAKRSRPEDGESDYEACERLLQSMCQMHDCLAVMINDVAMTMGTLVGKTQLGSHTGSQEVMLGKREAKKAETESQAYKQLVIPSSTQTFAKKKASVIEERSMPQANSMKKPGFSYIISKKEFTEEEMQTPIDHEKLLEELDDIEEVEDLVFNFKTIAANSKKVKPEPSKPRESERPISGEFRSSYYPKASDESKPSRPKVSPPKVSKHLPGLNLPVSRPSKGSYKTVY